MNIQKFIENFAAQFDDTDSSVFSSATNFKDLEEWSSLIALSVIMMVDEEYEIGIGAKEIISSETINDLYNIIISKIEN